MEYGLIGEHLPHSFSPEIHRRIGDYKYELKELSPDEVGAFLERRDFKGINGTIPYKQTVIPYLDEIDEAAKAIGAVNTVVNRGGKLYGYNTDFGGLKALIERTGVSVAGKKALIFGNGGTSKTAFAVLKALGATLVLVPGELGMTGCIAKAKEIIEENPGSFMPAQFKNPANPLAHYNTTAPEIFEQTEGNVDIFVAGAGTGGTVSGCGKYLK